MEIIHRPVSMTVASGCLLTLLAGLVYAHSYWGGGWVGRGSSWSAPVDLPGFLSRLISLEDFWENWKAPPPRNISMSDYQGIPQQTAEIRELNAKRLPVRLRRDLTDSKESIWKHWVAFLLPAQVHSSTVKGCKDKVECCFGF